MSEVNGGSYPGMMVGQQPQSHYMHDAQSAHTNMVSKSYYQEEGGMTSHPQSQHHYAQKPSQEQYIEMIEMQKRNHNQSNPRPPHPPAQNHHLQMERPDHRRQMDQESSQSRHSHHTQARQMNMQLTEEEEI